MVAPMHNIRLLLLVALCGAVTALGVVPHTPVSASQTEAVVYTIYDGNLADGWSNGSWDSYLKFDVPSPVYSSASAIAWAPTAPFAGLKLQSDNAIDTTPFAYLSFAVRASKADQRLAVAMYDANNQQLASPQPLALYGGDPTPAGWKVYGIPLSDLNAANRPVRGLSIQEFSGSVQPALFIDAVSFVNPASMVIFDDALSDGWQNWSWDSITDFELTAPLFQGSHTIAFLPTAPYAGFWLRSETPFDTSDYSAVRFALRALAPGQQYAVYLTDANNAPLSDPLPLANYGGDPSNAGWSLYQIPLTDLKGARREIKGLVIKEFSGSAQPAVFIDDIRLTVTYPIR